MILDDFGFWAFSKIRPFIEVILYFLGHLIKQNPRSELKSRRRVKSWQLLHSKLATSGHLEDGHQAETLSELPRVLHQQLEERKEKLRREAHLGEEVCICCSPMDAFESTEQWKSKHLELKETCDFLEQQCEALVKSAEAEHERKKEDLLRGAKLRRRLEEALKAETSLAIAVLLNP